MSRRRRKFVLDEEWVAGLPVEQRIRILRRWGRSDQEILAMDANQRISEVLEAIQCGIYAGSLPPAPMEDADALPLLDADTGKPIVWSEVVERGCYIAHAPMVQKPLDIRSLSFERSLALFQKDSTLDAVDREHLGRLAADDRMTKHWQFMQRCSPVSTWASSPGRFIWHMLAARRAADVIGDYPERVRQAESAEGLAKFLRVKGEADGLTYELLEDLAHQLREPHEFKPFDSIPIPLSRKSRNTSGGRATRGTRQLKAFMSWMRDYLNATYGQPLNEVVATATDIAFPGQETTLDRVRAAVKPTTRRGRSAKH